MAIRYENVRYEEMRLDFGKKQGEIAEILKVKRNTYSKWEKCINDMSLQKCNELVNFYNTTFDYLLGISSFNDNSNLSQKDIDLEILPQRLFKLRRKSNLTQDCLANKLGFFQRTYCNYENGNRIPTTLKLLVIAKFYEVSFDYLVGRKSYPKIDEPKRKFDKKIVT